MAIDLAEKGKDVTVIEMEPELNALANKHYKAALADRLSQFDTIRTMTKTRVVEVTKKGRKAVGQVPDMEQRIPYLALLAEGVNEEKIIQR